MAKKRYPAPFDRLRYRKEYEQFIVKVEHNGNPITIRIGAESPQALESLLPQAVQFWKSRVRWFKAFREYCASELLSNLNDILDCGQDDFREVTAAQVRKLLPVPFSIEFTSIDDSANDIRFEMAGGEDETLLDDCVFCVFGTLENGITDGSVETLD